MSKEQQLVEEHASLIKTPKQLIITVVLAFLVPIIIILMLVNMVANYGRSGAGSNALTPEAIDKRIAPVAGFDLVDANAPKVFKTGEQVFSSVCSSCHTAGVAGAPKVGDNAAWEPRIKEGLDAMFNIALHGKGAMPPKGGNPSLSDYEVERAVVFMVNKSGGDFKEPSPPAQPAGDQTQGASAAPAPAAPAPAPAQATQATPAAAGVGTATAQPPAAAAPTPSPSPQASTSSAQVNPVGEKLYKTTCFACHGTGVAGAPKLGNKADWASRLQQGMDTVYNIALHGKGAMPPKGGAANASDADIKAAVDYMVNTVK